MKFFISAFSALLFAQSAFAEGPAPHDAVKIASDYLAAYSTFKVEKMAHFYADDATFSDPTSLGQAPGGGSFTYNGKAAILEGLAA